MSKKFKAVIAEFSAKIDDLRKSPEELRGEIASLRQELEQAKRQAAVDDLAFKSANSLAADAETSRDEAEAERDALRAQLAALTPYVRHQGDCFARMNGVVPHERECTCGLDQLQTPSDAERAPFKTCS